MASFETVFKKKTESISDFKQGKLFRIHYSKLVQSAFQYRDITQEAVDKLADLLEADGEVLQPLLVRKNGSDSYEILAGHKRYLACRLLVEERGNENFSMIPCCIKAFDDVKAEFAIYSTNGYEVKTPYEQMKEIEGMARLMKEHPEAFPAEKGRLVERLARQLHISRSVVSDYQNISHNLCEKGKKDFQMGRLDKSAAVTLAAFPEHTQQEILKKGITTRKKIREYIHAEAGMGQGRAAGKGGRSVKDERDVESSSPEPKTQERMQVAEMLIKKEQDPGTGEDGAGRFPWKTEHQAAVLEERPAEEKDRRNMIRTGKCPFCGTNVYYPMHLRYCGHCGNPMIWQEGGKSDGENNGR